MKKDELEAYLNFDEYDLIQNRQKRISARQGQKVEKDRDQWAYYAKVAFLLSVCIATGFLVFREPLATTANVCGNVLFVILVGVGITGFAINKWNNFRIDANKLEALIIEGKAILFTRRERDGLYYFLEINGKRLKIRPPLFKLLKKNEAYKLYLSPKSNKILAIEVDEREI